MIFKGATALLALIVLSAAPAFAAVVASQASPGAVLGVEVSIDNDGRVLYSVARKGQPVIERSQLGFASLRLRSADSNESRLHAGAPAQTWGSSK